MSDSQEKQSATTITQEAGHHHHESLTEVRHADDVLLAKLGYKSEFKREFSVSLLIRAYTMPN